MGEPTPLPIEGVDAPLNAQGHHAQFVSVVDSIAAAKLIPPDAAASIVRSAVLTSLLLSSHRLAAIASNGSALQHEMHVPYLPAVFTAVARMVQSEQSRRSKGGGES
jgi:hypothetical protein